MQTTSVERTNTAAYQLLTERGYSTDTFCRWRLPHALYRPTNFELHLVMFMHHNGYNDRPWSDEAKFELELQSKKPWWCNLGIHSYTPWVHEHGPQAAIQMHQRSGAVVAIYAGDWKTCVCCGKQKMRVTGEEGSGRTSASL
jgi:hypothetical protein